MNKQGSSAVFAFLALAGLFVVGLLVSDFGNRGSATTSFTSESTELYEPSDHHGGPAIQHFTESEAQQLATELAKQEELHDVCFGWKLTDGYTNRSEQGSSRGAHVPANTCQRWVEAEVIVALDSGDDDDAADIKVTGSSNFTSLPDVHDFPALGITGDVLVADPVSGTGHVALAVPMLLVESGQLSPKDPEPATGQPAQPLPPASQGGHWGAWLLVVLLGLFTVGALIMGLVSRSKQQPSGPAQPPAAPVPPAGPMVPPQQPVQPVHQVPAPPQWPGPGAGAPPPPPPQPGGGQQPPWAPQAPPPAGPR